MTRTASMKADKKHHSLVDLDAPPYVPDGWEVESHLPGSPILGFGQHFDFYISKAQQNGSISGYELRSELASMPVVNANVLDHLSRQLMMNPRSLSDYWKYDKLDRARHIFFWGTIYRYDGDLCVRSLHWNGYRWESSYGWLSSQWNSYYQALLHP